MESNTKLDYICNQILFSSKVTENKIVGIVLTGSYAMAVEHAKSDIDIFVVIESAIKIVKYIGYMVDGALVQIRVIPFEKFASDCLIHERKRPAAYACKVIYDTNGMCEKYCKASQKYLGMGPLKMSDKESNYLYLIIENEIRSAEGLYENKKLSPAILTANHALRMMIDYYNNKNNYWDSNDNYLFGELQKNNLILGNLADDIVLCNQWNQKICMLKQFWSAVKGDERNCIAEYIYEEKYNA